MSPTTGVVLNNQMDSFSTPGLRNSDGIAPSEPNFIEPGKRPMSSMSPTIMLNDNGDVRLVLGASGSSRMITSISLVFPLIWLPFYFERGFPLQNKVISNMTTKEWISTPS